MSIKHPHVSVRLNTGGTEVAGALPAHGHSRLLALARAALLLRATLLIHLAATNLNKGTEED